MTKLCVNQNICTYLEQPCLPNLMKSHIWPPQILSISCGDDIWSTENSLNIVDLTKYSNWRIADLSILPNKIIYRQFMEASFGYSKNDSFTLHRFKIFNHADWEITTGGVPKWAHSFILRSHEQKICARLEILPPKLFSRIQQACQKLFHSFGGESTLVSLKVTNKNRKIMENDLFGPVIVYQVLKVVNKALLCRIRI